MRCCSPSETRGRGYCLPACRLVEPRRWRPALGRPGPPSPSCVVRWIEWARQSAVAAGAVAWIKNARGGAAVGVQMMGGALPLTSALGIVDRWIEPRLRHGMWAGSIDPCNPPIFRLLNFFYASPRSIEVDPSFINTCQ